jgi:hypothetical protein
MKHLQLIGLVVCAAFLVSSESTEAASNPNDRSAVLTVAAQTPSSNKSSPQMSDAKFDATRLRTGRFDYRIMQGEKQIATFTIVIDKQSDGSFRFAAKGLNQEWESIANRLFEPISATLRIDRPERKQSYSMKLTYDGIRVNGSAGTTIDNMTNEAKRSEMKPVTADVPGGTVDQRIDWAAMLATQLEIGQQLNFTVYDPSTGVSQVAGEVTKAEQIRVPAGMYETIRAVYRIKKSNGTESYEVLASNEMPRFMVREDFSSGISTELVKMSD